MKINMNYENFRSWLEKQPDDRHFTPQDGENCPIANYLKDQLKEQFPEEELISTSVGSENSSLVYPENPYGKSIENPRWAVEFIELFDERSESSPASPRVALMILDKSNEKMFKGEYDV